MPTVSNDEASLPQNESLLAIREDARRERLLDMQVRLRPYRLACFAILALTLGSVGSEVGWWWLAPLTIGLAGFSVADRFMSTSSHPAVWAAIAWGILPLLLADSVVMTGGASSPVLMWFALPALTLGARFDPRGIVAGTAYILALLLLSTIALDPVSASVHHQAVIASVALVICCVILSGALVESDRAHRRRSTLDPLTGLSNRNALEQRLAELDAQSASESHGFSHALLLCDLDHFKRVNDQLGHVTGDAVLQEVAYAMRATLRAGDSIYRVGGEEILVVLPSATEAEAADIAERLRSAVYERRPLGVAVSISIGVAVSESGPLDTDDLVVRADAALYSAKAMGRDMVVIGRGDGVNAPSGTAERNDDGNGRVDGNRNEIVGPVMPEPLSD
ncbi:MAG: GGDEF domain-containing protein [Solirubrobacterales bacterium]